MARRPCARWSPNPSGTPVHNGTTVTFQPSIGRTDPVDAQTVNGIATVTFLAGGVSGTGFIHAFSGGARTGSGNASSGGVEVTIGAAAAGGMSVERHAVERLAERRHGDHLRAGHGPLEQSAAGRIGTLLRDRRRARAQLRALSDANGFAAYVADHDRKRPTVTAIAGTAEGEAARHGVSGAERYRHGPVMRASSAFPVPITVTSRPAAATATAAPGAVTRREFRRRRIRNPNEHHGHGRRSPTPISRPAASPITATARRRRRQHRHRLGRDRDRPRAAADRVHDRRQPNRSWPNGVATFTVTAAGRRGGAPHSIGVVRTERRNRYVFRALAVAPSPRSSVALAREPSPQRQPMRPARSAPTSTVHRACSESGCSANRTRARVRTAPGPFVQLLTVDC